MSPETTVAELQHRLESKCGCPVSRQQLSLDRALLIEPANGSTTANRTAVDNKNVNYGHNNGTEADLKSKITEQWNSLIERFKLNSLSKY